MSNDNTDILVRLHCTKCELEIYPVARDCSGVPRKHMLFFSLQFPANHNEINIAKKLFIEAVKTVRISNTRIILVPDKVDEVCQYDEDNTTFNLMAISMNNDYKCCCKVEQQKITFDFFDEPKIYYASRDPLRSIDDMRFNFF